MPAPRHTSHRASRIRGPRPAEPGNQPLPEAEDVADPARPRSVVDHGLTHICLNVTDVAAECARLSAAGMRLHTQPISIGLPITGTYGRDPDGNIIELLEVLDENFALHMSKRYLGGVRT